MLSRLIQFSSNFFPDFRHPGEAMLQAQQIHQEQLKQLKLSPLQQYNLFNCVANHLIPIRLVKSYLHPACPWSLNQLHAMLSAEGLVALKQGELAAKDFCNEFISEELSLAQVLQQLRTLKHLRLNFFQQSTAEFKQQTLRFIDSPGEEHFPFLSAVETTNESRKIVARHSLFAKECKMSLPANEHSKIIQAAIYYARRKRKQGFSELESNDCTPDEFKQTLSHITSNRNSTNLAASHIMSDLRKKGFVENHNERALLNGALLHFKIVATQQTFLGNCDEMAVLILDYLDLIDYQHPACCIKIIYLSGQIGGHTLNLLACPKNGQVLVDAWTNKALPFNQKNTQQLSVWYRGKTASGREENRLEAFNPRRHQLIISQNNSLANLRLFRQVIKEAYQVKRGMELR